MLIPFWQLLGLTLRTYRTHFNEFFSYVWWLFVPAILIFLASSFPNESSSAFLTLIAACGQMVLYLFLGILLTLVAAKLIKKQKLDNRELFPKTWDLVWPVVWVGFFVGVAELIGFVLFIVPGIVISVMFTFTYYEIVLGNERGLVAMEKSRKLVTGRFWAVFGRLFFGMLLLLIPYFIAMSVTLPLPNEQAGALLFSIFQAVYLPVYTIFGVLMFHDLKKTRG